MGVLNFRIGHLGVPIPKPIPKRIVHKRDPNPTCLTGGFYTAPTSGQVVDTSQPVNITWDPTCLNTTAADIYIYSLSLTPPVLHMFQEVDFAKGSYEAELMPRWWDSSSEADLQLVIIEHDLSPSMATLPAGPIWTATYTPPPAGQPIPASADTSIVDSGITLVNNLPSPKSGGVSKGGIAAAVLVPLIIIGLGIAAYVRRSRARRESKRKRFSEAIDKRMSVISTDWRSLTAKGADAAIRASFAGDRMSMAGRNSIVNRTSSTFATEGAGDDSTDGGQQMTQIRRPGVGPRGPVPSTASGDRVSRVSFAADTRFSRASFATRPSGESRRSRAGIPSRAFHSSYVPPVPTVNVQNDSSDSDPERAMSPTQRDGPLTLSADDIRARVRGLQATSEHDPAPRPSIDEMIPALSMMRMRNDSQGDLLIGQDSPDATKLHHDITPMPPPPVATASAPSAGYTPTGIEIPQSPIAGAMPMSMHSPDTMMSPDDMLRVYAERRRTGGSSVMMSPLSPGAMSPPSPSIAFPMPVVTAPAPAPATNNPFRQSMAVNGKRRSEEYDNEDAYLGTAA